MKAKRDRLAIRYDILVCCRGKLLNQACLVQKVNVNHDLFHEVSGELLKAGLLSVEDCGGQRVYFASELGVCYVKHYAELVRLMGGSALYTAAFVR